MSARTITDLEPPPSCLPNVETDVGRYLKHFLLMPGLVPDARETFLRQRHLFQSHGSITSITYSRTGFDLAAVQATLVDRVRAAVRAGEQPVLVGVSVGGGIILDLLRQLRDAGEELPLSSLILISPFTCTDDLAPLLRRMIDPILTAGPDQAMEALEKGRAFFRMLASRSVSHTELVGWRKGLSLLTPSGLRAWHERGILARIEDTLAGISPEGAIARVTSLKQIKGIAGMPRRPLATCPTLILWGSKERQTLSMDGPGTSILCRPDLAYRVFPRAQIQWVYGDGGEEIPHASLLKHATAFNIHLKRFLRQLDSEPAVPRTAAAGTEA